MEKKNQSFQNTMKLTLKFYISTYIQIIYTMLSEFSFFSFLVTCQVRNLDLFALKRIYELLTIWLAEVR